MTSTTPDYSPPPGHYGHWWGVNGLGPGWYRSLFEARRAVHEAFVQWVKEHKPFESVLEVGCGCAFFYPEVFADANYTGVDISRKEIDWSRGNDGRAGHRYLCGDFVTMVGGDIEPGSFDLVFSHAVIDHVPDIDAFIRACVGASRGRLYLTAYSGWFPELAAHRQVWSPEHTCFYSSLSPGRVVSELQGLGCTGVQAAPFTGGPGLVETRLIAQAPRRT